MAVFFDGTTSTGLQAAPVKARPNSSAVSIAFFARIDANQGTFTPFLLYFCGSGSYMIETAADGVTLEFSENGGGASAVTAGALTIGQWYFIALTIDSSATYNLRLYWKPIMSPTLKQVSGTTGNEGGLITVYLGVPNALTTYLNGSMAGVRIWQDTLSQADLELESTSISPVQTAGLAYFWPLNSNSNLLNYAKYKSPMVPSTSIANVLSVADPPVKRSNNPVISKLIF